jgi:hypothetical protein
MKQHHFCKIQIDSNFLFFLICSLLFCLFAIHTQCVGRAKTTNTIKLLDGKMGKKQNNEKKTDVVVTPSTTTTRL